MRTGMILTTIGIFVTSICTTAAAEPIDMDNVVILLDGSGSMGEVMSGTSTRKMDAAKSALREVVSRLPATTHVGIIAFSEKMAQDWLVPLGPRDDTQLGQAINSLRSGGNTPLGNYMKIAADRLLQQRASQFGYGSYRLLVVTDGEAQDRDLVNKYTPEIMSRGITLDVIGVDMKNDHTLATRVHSYRRANDAASLQRAIADVLAEVTTSDTGAIDAADQDAFEMIAPLPAQTALSMIQALATSGNKPIGSRPRATPRPASPVHPAPMPSQSDNSLGAIFRRLISTCTTSCFVGMVLLGFIAIIVAKKKARRR